jgi:glycosyltransferase involved in cell wall biosynthesis
VRIAINAMVLGPRDTGVGTWLRDLIRALARVDRENEYVIYHRPRAGAIAPEAPGRFCFVPVRLPGAGPAARIAWERLVLPRRVRRDGAHVLHCPAYICPRSGVPTVVTLHDLFVYSRPAVCRRRNVLHFRLLLPGTMRHAAVLHCTSQWVRDCLRATFPRADARAVVVPPGVDPAFGPPDPQQAERCRREIGAETPPFLFVGSPEPKKNVGLLLAAFAELIRRRGRGRKLVLAGPPGWRSERLDRRIAELGLTGDVVRRGYVPRRELPMLYGASLALVFPSQTEGFGLPALEAMACGLPVITSGRGGLAECVGDAALLVEDLTADALADAMERVETDEELRRRLSQKGRERARRFDADEAALRMIELYTAAARTPGPQVKAEAVRTDTTTWMAAEGQP